MKLNLHNYRCFENLSIDLPSSNFIILDRNGSGKTSILSAIYSLWTGAPFPSTKFANYLMTGKEYFGINGHDKECYINGKIAPSGRLITKRNKDFDYQLFLKSNLGFGQPKQPESLKFLTYQPNDNLWLFQSRSFKIAQLDQIIDQSYGQISTLTKYLDKLTKHKLELIKHSNITGQIDWFTVDFVSKEILKVSIHIWCFRLRFWFIWQSKFKDFDQLIDNPIGNWRLELQLSNSFAKKQTLTLPDDFEPSSDNIKQWINTNLNLNNLDFHKLFLKEQIVEKILFGASRDDFCIFGNNQPIESRLSRGEMRLFVLFVRQVATQSQSNVWLLDDVFNELDDKRERLMLDQIFADSLWLVATGTRCNLNNLNKVSIKDLTIV